MVARAHIGSPSGHEMGKVSPRLMDGVCVVRVGVAEGGKSPADE
jgi:hypothetical protein